MKNLVILTGAGMSAESGISTFRDSGGLWEQYNIEDVATPQGWHKNPELVLDFYNKRRIQLINAEPNEGHRLLAELESKYSIHIITQNIDNLHERAGSSKVLHLHGELMKVRSTGDEKDIFQIDIDYPEIHLGDLCPQGHQLRPHIVWFGEAVPEIENAVKITECADILIVIGTSLQVYPAASLINYVNSHVPIYLIDPNDVNIHLPMLTIIKKGASEGIRELIKLLDY